MADTAKQEQILKKLKEELPILSERYSVLSMGVFGSYIHQEQKPSSDIDILITFDDPPGFLKFIELENHLTDILGIKVDLVMADALKPVIGQRILQEVVLV